MHVKYKRGLAFGVLLILISIAIGILFQNDIGFIFAGIGTVIIGITILMLINQDGKEKNGQKKDILSLSKNKKNDKEDD